jgi:hypothetical protein
MLIAAKYPMMVSSLFIFFYGHNADVLPPGHGRVVEVDVVELLPVGRDVLFDFCDGIATQNLRTPACRKPHPVSREKSGTPVVLRKT